MIKIGNKEISAITAATRAVAYVYHGAVLVWEAVRSCFGRGWWINDKPWRNDDAWRN